MYEEEKMGDGVELRPVSEGITEEVISELKNIAKELGKDIEIECLPDGSFMIYYDVDEENDEEIDENDCNYES